ncbi:MAG: hypothetical protein NZU63_05960 [Gemmataceae bacterium]|nr:hypothetical protein [Gemmataceae bacterium]
MPITMTCESCGKQFRARDESVGKRVKCPYCAAMMEVRLPGVVPGAGPLGGGGSSFGSDKGPDNPATRESEERIHPHSVAAPGPTSSYTVPSSAWSSPPTSNPSPADAPSASPYPTRATLLGGEKPRAEAPGPEAPRPEVPSAPAPFSPSAPAGPARGVFGVPPPSSLAATLRPPRMPGYNRWHKTRAGLTGMWLGLLLLIIPGLVEAGKFGYVRTGNQLPQGTGWVRIPGYINDTAPGSIEMSKQQQLDILLYGLPVLLGMILVGFGRLTCGAVPSETGARGLFAGSGLFTLLGGATLLAAGGAYTLRLEAEAWQLLMVTFLLSGLAEVWCLMGMCTIAIHLRRPAVPRAAGLLVLLVGLWIAWAIYARPLYGSHWRPQLAGQADITLWEHIVFALAYVVTLAIYLRAVAQTRRAVGQHLESHVA